MLSSTESVALHAQIELISGLYFSATCRSCEYITCRRTYCLVVNRGQWSLRRLLLRTRRRSTRLICTRRKIVRRIPNRWRKHSQLHMYYNMVWRSIIIRSVKITTAQWQTIHKSHGNMKQIYPPCMQRRAWHYSICYIFICYAARSKKTRSSTGTYTKQQVYFHNYHYIRYTIQIQTI